MNHIRFILLSALTVPLVCCVGPLVHIAVDTPNQGKSHVQLGDSPEWCLGVMGIDRQMRVKVGPPQASLMLWIIEPEVAISSSNTAHGASREIRGTILVLHGYGDGPFWMLGQAKNLARQGYRTVLVAQRGYGHSTGDFRTYGVVEREDLSQVIDALQKEKLCGDRVGVWGMSYGAAMAIELAGHDPRVGAVVAVAPFTCMRDIVPHFLRTVFPIPGILIDEAGVDEIIAAAAAKANFNPDDAGAIRAIARTHAAVLLVHGTWDRIVPYEHSVRLRAAAKTTCELVTIPLATHVSIWFDPDGQVARNGSAWFDKHLVEKK